MANPADAVRPWDSLNADEKKLFSPPGRGLRRLLGVHRRPGRPHHRLPGADRAARQHRSSSTRADNGASGEGSPNGSVNENKFFNGYPDELAENLKLHRRARQPGHLRALPDRLGGRLLDAVQDVQALLGVRGRHLRPAGHLLAQGHQGARRGAQPVPPLHRHRPDHPGRLRAGDAQGLQGRRAVPALRRLDALQLRRSAGRADAEEAPVLRDARHPRHLGGRLEGRRRPRPD